MARRHALALERGDDMGSRDSQSQSQTLFYITSYRGDAEVVSLLIDHGAHLYTEEPDWGTATTPCTTIQD
jgi:hypothetical protein